MLPHFRTYQIYLITVQSRDRPSTVSVESQHSTGVPTCHAFPRFVIISEKLRPEVRNRWLWSSKNGGFWEKRPLTGKFLQMFSKAPHADTETRLSVQISWNLAGEIARYLMDKKSKFRLALPLPLLRGSRPKFVRDSSKPYTPSSPNFIQIRSLPAEL